MKKIYSFLVLLMFAVSINAQTDFTIGSATGSNTGSNYPCPIQDFYEGSRSQYLYLASELQAAGMTAGLISSLKFDVSSLNTFTGTVEQYSIAIGTTSVASLSTSSWESGTASVFGPVDYVPVVGVNEFVFSTPFFWDGTSNIVIEICNGDPNNSATGVTTWTNNASSPFTSALGFTANHTYRADNQNNLCGTASTLQTGDTATRPDITFSWIVATACSGAPLAGDASTTKTSVCPNEPFTLSVANGFLGTGMTYQWQSAATVAGTFTDIPSATGFSLLINSGITTNKCYRRKTTCTASSSTVISTPVCITVKPFYECYCSPNTNTPLHGTSTLATIESVAIVGGTLNYTNAHTGSNPSPSLGYASFTDTTAGVVPVLQQATSYTLTTTTSSTPFAAGYWIDWNHNNLFDSAEYTAIPFVAAATTADIDIDVPATAPLGLTMMRIRTANVAVNYNNACTNLANGETEDYIFKVTPGTPCTGVPLGGTTQSVVDSICPNNPFALSVINTTTGVTNLVYQWEVQANCTGSWTIITGATNKNYTVSGINANTSYRRKITCGGASAYSTPICVYLKPIGNCYCGPNTGITLQGGSAPWIHNLNFDDNNGYTWDATTAGITNIDNITPGIDLAYAQYADTSMMPTLAQAVIYTTTVTQSAAPTQASVWIDFDHSGSFDASERQNLTISGTTSTLDISVPPTAQLGITMMRVRIRSAAIVDACTEDFSGETEDYVVKIIPGTACSGTPVAGDAMSSKDSICKNTSFDLSVANATAGVTNLTYQWYSMPTIAGTATAIVGATSLNYTVPSITTDMCFKRGMKCNNGTEVFSTAVCVAVKAQFECYCSPLNGTVLQNGTLPSIDTVMIDGTGVNYLNEHIGVNPAPSFGYAQFIDTSLAPKLVQGETYDLSIHNSAAPTQATLWIDWDQSGTFDNSEKQSITNTKIGTAAIVIPATAVPGFTMMRIRVRAATFATACETNASGETEDHLIKVIAGTPCTGTPLGGTTAATLTSVCNNVPFTLSVSGSSLAVGILGLNTIWQDSTIGGTWQTVSGVANKSTYTTSLTNKNKYFRRKITCTTGNLTAYSSVLLVSINSPLYATLPFTESFENNWIDGCGDAGARSIPTNNWRNTPFTGDTSWRRNDDGVSANWTNEASGAYTPTASAGTKSARFHVASIPTKASSNLDLYVNCSGGASLKRLNFDYINVDGMDSVSILISTDTGKTFTRIDSIGNRATWANKKIEFASTSATTVIRFRATGEVGGTSDIGLDNINVISLLPIDISATTVVAPIGSIGATSTGTITVTIKNMGGSDINFATTPCTVTARLTNPSSVITDVSFPSVNTGILAIGATQNVTMNTADFSALGLWTIKAWAKIAGDGNVNNDTTITTTSFTVNSPAKTAIASGFWGDGATWSGGVIPIATDTVNISGFTVTLAGGAAPSPYSCNSIGIGANGSLIVNGAVLNVGPAAGGSKPFTIANGGTINFTGGTINHNGFMTYASGSTFNMSAGNLNIDGNNGANLGSVPAGTDLLGIGTVGGAFATGTVSLTGGTITIVDPHRFNGNAFAYRGTQVVNNAATHTLIMGTPTSTHTSSNGTAGFLISTATGGARMSLGSVTINGGNAVGNRFTSTAANTGINGNLTINANSELRMQLTPYVAGNIVNDGILACSSPLNLQTFIAGTAGAVATTQSISGNGIYRNNFATAAVSGQGSGYTVGDVLTLTTGTAITPLTIYVTSVGGAGNVTGATVLNMGNYTAAPTATATAATGGTGTGATFTSSNTISIANFGGLVINNTSAAGVNISSFGTMMPSQTGTVLGTGTFKLSNGIINNQVPIILGNSTSQTGTFTYVAGVITGKFARWFAPAVNSLTTGDFPVGKGTFARNTRVEFTTAPTKGGILTAEYIATAPGKGGFPLNDGITLNTIANDGFWRIDTDSITGGNYTVSITDSGIVNAQTVATLRMVKRPSNTTNWTIDGLSGTNFGSLTKPTVVRTGCTGFSEFAIAGSTDNLLPSRSITFKGEKAGNVNRFNWVVVNEIDVKGYDLQKSTNGVVFETINFIASKAIGTANNTVTYNYTDATSIYNDGYYRLKQVSKDGTIAYSNIVLIKGLKVGAITVGSFYPNPVKDIANVIVASPKAGTVTINITDMAGRHIMKVNKAVVVGDNTLQLNVNSLTVGSYLLSIIDATGNKSNVVEFIK
jgi:GEVED domain/Secretion system C-terminal sorting domain